MTTFSLKRYTGSYSNSSASTASSKAWGEQGCDPVPVTMVIGKRVQNRAVSPYMQTALIDSNVGIPEFYQTLNSFLAEDETNLQGIIAAAEEMLRNMMILDGGMLNDFRAFVAKEDQTYLMWKHLAEDGDWFVDTIPALTLMPEDFMKRYFLEMSSIPKEDNNRWSSLYERLEVVSKNRNDFFGMPTKMLYELYRT